MRKEIVRQIMEVPRTKSYDMQVGTSDFHELNKDNMQWEYYLDETNWGNMPKTCYVTDWQGACRIMRTAREKARWGGWRRRKEVGILNRKKKKSNSFSPEESALSSGRSLAPSQTSDCLWNNPTLIRQ